MSAWFFAALAMITLLSPPGATHDEWYHTASIWCGHGVRSPYCQEIGVVPEYGMSAVVNVVAINCKAAPTEPLLCPTGQQKQSRPLINDGLYPPVFYFVLSWFVVPSVEFSVILVRMASAFSIALLFGLSIWLLPARFRTALFLVVLTGFSSTGFFLFASLNPSSWSAAGIGIGWLPLFAAFMSRNLHVARRIALAATGILGFFMAAGSRWDVLPMISFVLVISAFYLGWELRPQWRKNLSLLTTLVPLALFALLERFSPFSPVNAFQTLYTYSEGQPDNTVFFSYNLTQALPNALRALGTVPSLSLIVIPKIVYSFGLLLLFYTMSQTIARSLKWQIAGFTGTVVLMAVLIMAQVANNDYRDIGSIEPRYTYPLLLFGIGWWFLQSSEESLANVRKQLRYLSAISVVLFSASTFSIAERYVDRQSFGIRAVPEGPDQWWWSWMPLGPNTVIVLSILFVSIFFSRLNNSLCAFKSEM